MHLYLILHHVLKQVHRLLYFSCYFLFLLKKDKINKNSTLASNERIIFFMKR
ncbi:hypothetical protein [Escherichia coli IS25]|nr:hypothetical protein [Escherichia coli IS25]